MLELLDICVSRSSSWILLGLSTSQTCLRRRPILDFAKSQCKEHRTSSSSFPPLLCCKEYWRSVITLSRGRAVWGTESQDPVLCGLGSFQRIFFHRRDCREGLINSPQADSPAWAAQFQKDQRNQAAFSPSTVLGIHSVFLLKWWVVWLSTHYCSLNFPLWLKCTNLYFKRYNLTLISHSIG